MNPKRGADQALPLQGPLLDVARSLLSSTDLPASSPGGPVGVRASLMVTCLGDALFPRVGVGRRCSVLGGLGVDVDFPAGQTCCGQPAFNAATGTRRGVGASLPATRSRAASTSCRSRARARRWCATTTRGSLPAAPRRRRPGVWPARTFEFSAVPRRRARRDDLPVAMPRRGDVASLLPHPAAARRRGAAGAPARHGRRPRVRAAPARRGCCGFGGTFAVKMPAISAAMVDDKVDHVLETGADLLVGLDMSCLMNIEGRLRRRGARVAVQASRRGAGGRDGGIERRRARGFDAARAARARRRAAAEAGSPTARTRAGGGACSRGELDDPPRPGAMRSRRSRHTRRPPRPATWSSSRPTWRRDGGHVFFAADAAEARRLRPRLARAARTPGASSSPSRW